LLTGIGFTLEADRRDQLSSLSEGFVSGGNQNAAMATHDNMSARGATVRGFGSADNPPCQEGGIVPLIDIGCSDRLPVERNRGYGPQILHDLENITLLERDAILSVAISTADKDGERHIQPVNMKGGTAICRETACQEQGQTDGEQICDFIAEEY